MNVLLIIENIVTLNIIIIANDNDIRLNQKVYFILIGTKRDRKIFSDRIKLGGRHETTCFCDICS